MDNDLDNDPMLPFMLIAYALFLAIYFLGEDDYPGLYLILIVAYSIARFLLRYYESGRRQRVARKFAVYMALLLLASYVFPAKPKTVPVPPQWMDQSTLPAAVVESLKNRQKSLDRHNSLDR